MRIIAAGDNNHLPATICSPLSRMNWQRPHREPRQINGYMLSSESVSMIDVYHEVFELFIEGKASVIGKENQSSSS